MPDLDLKKFDLEHWWKMLAAAGIAVSIASIAVKYPPTIFVGLGLFAAGIGEWVNHPYQEKIGFNFKLTGHPRSPRISGLLLDGAGLILAFVGLVKLALS
ncbi:hypothetical protein [Tardiphaga sp. 862_B3_N1_1]|uniref:hypothetical protein n=1 Tax=Tardiphaga sp. 862_B3_N1_1 TaxID=3240763 RepID=UPI003F8C0F67